MLFGGLGGASRNIRASDNLPSQDAEKLQRNRLYVSESRSSQSLPTGHWDLHSAQRHHSLSPTALFSRTASSNSHCTTETNDSCESGAHRKPLKSGYWQILGRGALIKPLTTRQTVDVLKNPLSNLEKDLIEAQLIVHIMDDPSSDVRDGLGAQNVNTNTTTIETTHRTPDSPSLNDFFWDPSGDTNYASDTFDSDLYDFEDSRANARLGRTQEDLQKYKQRIDANVEHQREYSEIMNVMHQKLQEYRKHITKLENRLLNKTGTVDASLLPDSLTDAYLTEGQVGGYGPTSVNVNTDIWTLGGAGARGGGRFVGDTNQNFDTVIRLDEERRRSDEYKMQLDNERHNNEQLQLEIERIRREYERDVTDKERRYQARERNLAQYLSDEQKKMLDLWTELQRVRRQFNELKETTKEDLERQRNDFTKIFRNIQNFTKTNGDGGNFYLGGAEVGTNSNYNLDTVIHDTIRRAGARSGTSPYIADLDLLAKLRKGVDNSSDNTDLYNELMKKYEEAIERNIAIESRGDENTRKVSDLEAELRRTRDRLSDAQSAIRKMHNMTINNDKDSTKRARSLSPTDTVVQPADAIRTLRNTLREKDNELQRLERKIKAAEKQANDFVSKFETADEARRRLDKYLADAKRDVANLQKHLDESERQKRRFEDRIRSVEAEKVAAEKARLYLEDELKRLQQLFNKSTTDDARKAREENEEFVSNLEQDYKTRISELLSRIDGLQKENGKLKSELGPFKDRYRNLESEYNTLIRRLEEKDSQIKYSEDQRTKVLSELDKLRNIYDATKTDFDRVSTEHETTLKQLQVLDQQNKELKQQRDEFSKQRDELSRTLFDIKHKMESEKNKGDSAEKSVQNLNDEIEKLKSQLGDYENQIVILRRHNDDLDTQLKTAQSKQGVTDNDVQTKTKEITTLNELNVKLQREKQEILDAKHKNEQESDSLKDRIRKLETELEKIAKENGVLENKEAKAQEDAKTHLNRANTLQRDLDEARQRIQELEEKLAQLDKDFKDRLKNWARNRQSTKSTDVTSSTDSTTFRGGRASDPATGDLTDDIVQGGGGAGGDQTTTTNIDTTYITKYGLGDATYLDPEIVESRIKDINDKWKIEFDKIENEKDQLESKIKELEDQIALLNRGEEKGRNGLLDDQRKLQSEIDRLKIEINTINDKHQNDLEEEKEQYQKNIDAVKHSEDELRDQIIKLEKQLADALNQQNEYDRERRDYDDRLNTLTNSNQKLRDDLEDNRAQAEKDVQAWKTDAYASRSEVKSLETALAGIKSQLSAASERTETLNKTVNDYAAKIRDLNNQIRKLEEDLADSKSNASAKEIELESALNRLHQLEEQLVNLQTENVRVKGEHNDLSREHDTIKEGKEDLERDSDRLRKRVKELEAIVKEQRNSGDHLKIEHQRLQNILREKSKQFDHLNQLSSQFETKLSKLRRELHEVNEKLSNTENEKQNLSAELVKLQQELNFGKEQMIRKTDEYQSAVEDWSNAHRTAEDARLNAIQELETRKYELSDLQSRLDSTEQRLTYLQNEYVKADNERDALRDSLRRFQSSISRVININKLIGDPSSGGVRFSGIGGGAGVDPSSASAGDMTDSTIFQSQPFPAAGPDGGQGGGAAGGVSSTGISIDLANLDNTLQSLVDQIDRLQRERNNYRDELNRLKQKTSQASTTINKRETHYKTIEENFAEVEDDKRNLEVHLAQAKQLIRSQEDAIKQRDDERRQLKSKFTASDLQARGKEAQIRHLNEQLTNLRNDLTSAHDELRNLRDKDESLESGRFHLESKLRDHESEIQKLSIRITNYENGKQSLTEKVKELEGQLKLSETKNLDLRDDTEKLRRDLLKAESVENDLRKSLDQYHRTNVDVQTLRDQLSRLQTEVNDANNKRQSVENELLNARTELRDFKQRSADFSSRNSDLQRQLQDANLEKNRLENRLLDLEKTLGSQRAVENDLKQQVEVLKTEKKDLVRDFDEIKKRLTQLETERGNLLRVQDSWKREKITLVKKIEILEGEKRRTDAAIRETALQREAIEKSLNAMEKENRELYKNCAQLQQQIAQLEMENGKRIIELTKKQREEQERQTIKIKTEKQQIERLIESRDRTARQRIKQLEDQLISLREQLDNERRRRRDINDRQIVGDIGRLGGTYFGSPIAVQTRTNVNGFSSVGPYLPMENIDNTRYVRSTFASNPLTPPRGASTPTRSTLLATSVDDSGSTAFDRERGFDQERHEPLSSLDDTLPSLSHTRRL